MTRRSPSASLKFHQRICHLPRPIRGRVRRPHKRAFLTRGNAKPRLPVAMICMTGSKYIAAWQFLVNGESALNLDVISVAAPVELKNSSVLPSSLLPTYSTMRIPLKTMQVQRRTSRQAQGCGTGVHLYRSAYCDLRFRTSFILTSVARQI